MNILLIEDDAGLVELITTNIEELGFSVISATSGTEAFAYLKKHTPDLILLDYSLPDINGKELIETLIKQQIPIPAFIITTGQGDERIAVDMMKLGAMDYLIKDILFLEKLPDVVQRVIKEIESDARLKQVEQALKESKEAMELTEQIAKLGGWSYDVTTMTPYMSKEIIEIYELTPPRIPSMEEGVKYYAEEDRPKIEQAFQECMEQGTPYDLELRFITEKGNKRWVRAVGKAEKVKGTIVKLSGFLQDITGKKESEISLQISEERFELAMAAAQDGLYDWNLVTNDIYYSPRWKSMLGYEDKELPNDFSVWEKLIEPKDAEASWKMQQELINKQRNRFELEFKMKHKEGHWVDILSRAEAVFDVTGKAIRIVGTHVDITERKQTELDSIKAKETAEKSEDKLKVALKSMTDAIFISDQEGNFIDFNEAFATFHKFKNKKECAKTLTDYPVFLDVFSLDGEFVPLEMWVVPKALRGETGLNEEYVLKRKDTGESWVGSYNYSPIRNNEGEIIGSVVTARDITDKKQAEEKILAAEENLKNTFDLSPSIICKANLDTGYFIEANKAVTRILGYTVEEFTSKPFIELIHPDDQQESTDEKDKQIEGKEVTFFENRYLCKDGSYNWMAWQGTKADENGIVTAIGSDINERKIIEQEIVKTKQFYENITEGVQDGIWVTDINDVIFYANAAVEKIAGVPRDQIQGNNILKDFPEETTGEIIKYYKQAKREKKPIWYDIKVRTLANKDTWQNGWLIPQYQDKVFNGIICTVRDVTERKKAESSVRRLSTAVEQGPSMVVITDTDGILEYVNPKFTKTTGYSSAEAIGQESNILKSGEQDSGFYKEMWETVDSGEVWRGQFHNKKKNGELFWEAASISTILNESGDVVNFIKIGEDITQQKNTEIELKAALEKAMESDRLKSAFLANMSHEIRTPMNGILGFAGLLKEPNLTGDKQQEYISIIQKGGARMLNIINDIVSISMIESGQTKLSIKETNINQQIEYIHNFFKIEVEEKGIQFSFSNPLSLGESIIKTDREKVFAILTNLVKNAIKYTDAGSIELGYNIKENFIEFYVKDTGIGIPKDRQKAIFERFIQADIEDEMARQGAGLGLSISKAFVEALGGKIWVESDEEKVGSTFYFNLPYQTETIKEVGSENSIVHPVELASINKLKILIVEDDEMSEELISIIVQEFGKEILISRTGKEAVEACHKNPDIDLILMDIQLPEMNGYEATKCIREFNKDVVIIAQTAYALEGDKEKAIASGCNDYISKPINKDSLLKIITNYF